MGLVQTPESVKPAAADISYVRDRVRAAGSSFYWAMRFLPQAKRETLFAIYAFCREVDDIADGDLDREGKIVALDRWRQKIEEMFAGRAADAITRALTPALPAYKLRKKDFIAVIEGMEMDARGPIVAPSLEELDLYCDRVASAVGRLCIHVFGEPTHLGERVSNKLGRALQLTNILRDVDEDAAIGRLYLPAEILAKENVSGSPTQIAKHPDLPKVMAAVGELAETAFSEAKEALAACDKNAVRPAVIMMMVYRRHLDALRANAWKPLPPRGPLGRAKASMEKLWIALHYGLF